MGGISLYKLVVYALLSARWRAYFRGLTKGWFSKRLALADKTGTRVHSDVPLERKTGTRVHSDVPPERKPERGYLRQNRPFTKPPFCLPVRLLQKYRDRTGRCNAILFKSIGVRGRCDSPESLGILQLQGDIAGISCSESNMVRERWG